MIYNSKVISWPCGSAEKSGICVVQKMYKPHRKIEGLAKEPKNASSVKSIPLFHRRIRHLDTTYNFFKPSEMTLVQRA